jgi:hypothetical protein
MVMLVMQKEGNESRGDKGVEVSKIKTKLGQAMLQLYSNGAA